MAGKGGGLSPICGPSTMPTKPTKSTNLRRKSHGVPEGKVREGANGKGRTDNPSAFGARFVGIVGIVDFVEDRDGGGFPPIAAFQRCGRAVRAPTADEVDEIDEPPPEGAQNAGGRRAGRGGLKEGRTNSPSSMGKRVYSGNPAVHLPVVQVFRQDATASS